MRNTFAFLLLATALCLVQACGEKYVFSLDEHIGICGTGWAEAAQKCGLDYLEANVSSFLCPESDDSVFTANREALAGALADADIIGSGPRE